MHQSEFVGRHGFADKKMRRQAGQAVKRVGREGEIRRAALLLVSLSPGLGVCLSPSIARGDFAATEVATIKGKMPVINLEGKQGKRSRHKPATSSGVHVSGGGPAPFEMSMSLGVS